jgi:hypothetical protein
MLYRNEFLKSHLALGAIGTPLESTLEVFKSSLGGGMQELLKDFEERHKLIGHLSPLGDESFSLRAIQESLPSKWEIEALTGVASLIPEGGHWASISGLTAFSSAFEDVLKLLSGEQAMLATSIAALVRLPEEASFLCMVQQPSVKARLRRAVYSSLDSCLGIVSARATNLEASEYPSTLVCDIQRQTAISAAVATTLSLDTKQRHATDYETVTTQLFEMDDSLDVVDALKALDPALARALLASRFPRHRRGDPGYMEHAAISMRKTLEGVLSRLAPVVHVESWLNEQEGSLRKQCTKKNGRPNQTGQMAYLLRRIVGPKTGMIHVHFRAQLEIASTLLRFLHDCAHELDYEISHEAFVVTQFQLEGLLRLFLWLNWAGDLRGGS